MADLWAVCWVDHSAVAKADWKADLSVACWVVRSADDWAARKAGATVVLMVYHWAVYLVAQWVAVKVVE